ncbi:MAG TPA: sensor histidine kinase [Clostridia bacterium]|nr:sensor histidine kinase [Clostridia bacterium]
MLKHPAKTLAILSIFFIILAATFTISHAESTGSPEATGGVLDLTCRNWEQDGIVALNGQWEFYWQKLLAPGDFQKAEPVSERELIVLPRAWNKYVLDGEELPGDGYATYRLLIRHSADEVLAIKIPRIFTSYRLWANGELIASAGNVGTTYGQTVPQYLPQVKYIRPEAGTLELIIQVTNFRHRSGGILESIQLGPAEQIIEARTRNLALELFLFGSLFIIGFYHIALYIFRTKDRSTLYFGIYSLLISARTLLVGEIYFIHLFPGFSWEAAHKIQTLAFYIGVPLVILFLKSTFPEDISRQVNTFIQITASGFGVLVLFTPARIFSRINTLYQVFSFAVIVYALYIAVITCLRKREGSYLIGIGLSILILFTINDMIFLSIMLADSDNHFLRSFVTRGNLSSWGLLLFVFTQSLVLARRFSKSFSEVELLTEQLWELNANLEEKVNERTLALETSKEELKKAYQAVSRSEKSLKDLMQNISHDLRTPLSAVKGFANAILDGIVEEPQEQKKYLKRIIEKVNHLNHMVQELLDLSQLQSRQLKFEFSRLPVDSFIEYFSEKYSFDMENENIRFRTIISNWQSKHPDMAALYVMVDHQRLERVFSNLLNNALKYTPAGGSIELRFSFSDDDRNLIAEVSDTGIGIPEEDLPHVFERFYMVSKARQGDSSSRGLGLAIVKEIIEYHNGRIWVISKLGQGSHFFFTLPVYNINESDPDFRSGQA